MPDFSNRLINEKSPYLQQHAHNPVDWYPWGEDAFELAAREDKPIFLSIGYATCHWCHVMERESFENEVIAKQMNEAFVCIKVDREERPDIDNIYMTVCQMMTGQGGWPLTILMTAEKKPFHAATYIPPDSRYGRIGMKQLVPRITDAWKNRRNEILASSGRITEVLASQNTHDSGAKLSGKVLDEGYRAMMEQYDSRKGGFGQRPKFPMAHRLLFLLRQGQPEGIMAAEQTLEAMRKGGLFDQVGFGFHRYSTDDDWLVPHFEKMLYDQAMLALAYSEAYGLTRKPIYRQVAEEILTYVLRDMTSPEGGFYSAEDADAEGEEGLFYIWDAREMESILGKEQHRFAAKHWNISEEGNFRDEATGRITGKNIPHLTDWPSPEDMERLESVRQSLFAVREERVHPLKDKKILADWNGLMIGALAKAGRILGEQRYVDTAAQGVRFVERYLRQENGELFHRYCDGEAAVPGQLDDYAFMIFGLLELYEATLDERYLSAASGFNDILNVSFRDTVGGGYFMTSSSAEALIVRPKSMYDGAIPSGNSMQMYNLLRMARLTGRFELEQEAGDTGRAFGGEIQSAPSAFAQALVAFQFGAGKTQEVVVVGDRNKPDCRTMLDYIVNLYNPLMTVLFKDVNDSAEVERIAPFTKEMGMVEGQSTVYICRNFTCDQPINSLADLKVRLAR